MTKLSKFHRELKRADRLFRLMQREGKDTYDIHVLELPEPSGEDTPDIDIDATPFDGYAQKDEDEE